MDQQQTQQQPGNDKPRVQWGPGQRFGEELDRLRLEGEDWSQVRSDGWHERLDHPGYYQMDAVPGLTKPCVLIIRSRDLQPAAPAQQKPTMTAGVREDLAEALRIVRSAMESGSAGPVKLVTLERLMQGIQAQVEQT